MPKPIKMTAKDYARIRERLDYSNYAFCHFIGVSLRHAYRYEAGHTAIPQTVARLMLMYDRYGIPKDWL